MNRSAHAHLASADGRTAAKPETTQGDDPIEVGLLGGFSARSAGSPITLPINAQRLIAFLALHDRSFRRSYVAGTLWPDVAERRALGSLRSVVWSLRRGGYRLLETKGPLIGLRSGVRVDFRHAAEAAHRLLISPASVLPADLDPALLSGDLLPDWYDEFVVAERERFHHMRIHALEILCERLTELRMFGLAAEAGAAATSASPLRESAHRVLIKLHLAEGNRAAALRLYESLRALLREELDVEPSTETRRLLHGI